ncbi:MAG: ATP synthase F1 subunit gamma [Vulcanimicrobiaceae bacterium]
MPSVRDLRDRIRSLKNTQQITKAMKQVAAAKIRRAEAAQRQARPYADAILGMLGDLLEAVGRVDHPFMRPGTAGAPRGILLITSDKGLAGAFNSNLIRTAEALARESNGVVWYALGNKARNAVRRSGQAAALSLATGGVGKLELARQVAVRVADDFGNGTISELVIVRSELINRMTQRPQRQTLLPVAPRAHAAHDRPRNEVEFAPSPEYVLGRLLPKYLEFTLYSALLETDAAYFAAQLVAMTNATDNASKLIDQLTIDMNKARQAAITKEILEIVGGADALAG